MDNNITKDAFCATIGFFDGVHRGHQYECKEYVSQHLFYLHNVEGIGLLLKSVKHSEAVAYYILHFLLGIVEVGSRLQPYLQRRQHTILIEQATCEIYRAY